MTARVSIFGFRTNRRIALSRVRRMALRAINSLGLTGEFELIFADSALMRQLNAVYRGKKKSTDVLSFSYPGSMPRGQIFLNREAVQDPNELTRLLVHAIVHVGGYDHRTPAEKRRMEKKEKEILHESLHFRA